MTDKKRDQIKRGTRAKQALENRIVTVAFERIDQRIVDDWRSCKEPQKRDEFWYQQDALYALKGCLKEFVITGKNAQKEIERK